MLLPVALAVPHSWSVSTSCPGLVSALVLRCARGDRAALGTLFDLLYAPVAATVGGPGVPRDDLPDCGAWLYSDTVRAIHELNPDTGVENLIPDFNGEPNLLREVFESRPEVLAHNVETVPRIFKRIRPAFRYER